MNKFFFDCFAFIFGASIGSFLNVVIDRMPGNKSILGRSHCDFCGKKIAWYDLFPIFSFIALNGRCRYCKKKLYWQYPLIEFVTGLIFLLVVNYKFPASSYLQMVAYLGILSSLIVIFVTDVKYNLISDWTEISLFFFAAILKLVTFSKINFLSLLRNDTLSSLAVAAPIFIIYRVSKEKAMGLGDVFLALNIGFLLGWRAGLLALYIGFFIGAVVGLTLILLKRKKIKSTIAFGPFMIIGLVTMLFWQDIIFTIIKRIYGF